MEHSGNGAGYQERGVTRTVTCERRSRPANRRPYSFPDNGYVRALRGRRGIVRPRGGIPPKPRLPNQSTGNTIPYTYGPARYRGRWRPPAGNAPPRPSVDPIGPDNIPAASRRLRNRGGDLRPGRIPRRRCATTLVVRRPAPVYNVRPPNAYGPLLRKTPPAWGAREKRLCRNKDGIEAHGSRRKVCRLRISGTRKSL
jgi:hypothetical protein